MKTTCVLLDNSSVNVESWYSGVLKLCVNFGANHLFLSELQLFSCISSIVFLSRQCDNIQFSLRWSISPLKVNIKVLLIIDHLRPKICPKRRTGTIQNAPESWESHIWTLCRASLWLKWFKSYLMFCKTYWCHNDTSMPTKTAIQLLSHYRWTHSG